MNKGILLLKTLRLSTSQLNIYRHTSDRQKRKKIVAGAVGHAVLYAMLMAYCIVTCIGYGMIGVANAIPVMCALTLSVLAFAFTLFKTNGYLFNFREYDMLMSLPFESKTIAASKFLYMYVDSLPWYLTISVSMMIGYGCYAHPSVVVYPLWLVLSVLLPVIPTLTAAFLGFLFARVSSGFRRTNVIQTVLTFIFILFCFSLRFIIEGMVKSDEVRQTLEMASKATDNAANVYLPARWFTNAVTRLDMLDALLLIGTSVLLFTVVFRIVGASYRNINSALKSHAAARNYRIGAQKHRSVVRSVAFKEYKRLTDSTVYMTNVALGELLAVLLGIITLVVDFDSIVSVVTRNAPFDHSILQPAIPFIVYFMVGMCATTACSPSLEGRNYWIVQSLPIKKKALYQGKMLFNLYLTIPAMAFSTLCLCISARVPVLDTILYLVLGLALCAFSTAWGCVCGVRHMRLDWENEVEVIKQGTAVALYLLPNMFVVMGLTVLVVFLGTMMNHGLLALAFTLVATALAALSYRSVVNT